MGRKKRILPLEAIASLGEWTQSHIILTPFLGTRKTLPLRASTFPFQKGGSTSLSHPPSIPPETANLQNVRLASLPEKKSEKALRQLPGLPPQWALAQQPCRGQPPLTGSSSGTWGQLQ